PRELRRRPPVRTPRSAPPDGDACGTSPSDRSGHAVARLTSASHLHKCDAECDPRVLEHEQADVVDRVGVERNRNENAHRADGREDPGAPESGAKPGRDQHVTDGEQKEAETEQDEVPREALFLAGSRLSEGAALISLPLAQVALAALSD